SPKSSGFSAVYTHPAAFASACVRFPGLAKNRGFSGEFWESRSRRAEVLRKTSAKTGRPSANLPAGVVGCRKRGRGLGDDRLIRRQQPHPVDPLPVTVEDVLPAVGVL